MLFRLLKTFLCLDTLSDEFGYLICLHFICPYAFKRIYGFNRIKVCKVFVCKINGSNNIEEEEEKSP